MGENANENVNSIFIPSPPPPVPVHWKCLAVIFRACGCTCRSFNVATKHGIGSAGTVRVWGIALFCRTKTPFSVGLFVPVPKCTSHGNMSCV